MGSKESEKPQDHQEIVGKKRRVEKLVAKDTLSQEELKEFFHLIWSLGETRKEFDEEMPLPQRENPSMLLVMDNDDEDLIDIFLCDGVERYSGEIISLVKTGNKIEWRIGISQTYYSRLLRRPVKLRDTGPDILSETPLTPKECGKLANLIWQVYQQG